MRGGTCQWCGARYYTPEGLTLHKQKPHYQCPLCPRAMVRLARHLENHYWQDIRPLVQEHLDKAERVN